MSFYDWLHQPEPNWKTNLQYCNEQLFDEINMSRDKLEKILEKLEEYEIFESRKNS